jgi:hypothetical protein
VATALVAGLVAGLASGCVASKATREGARELDDALGTPAWADSVDVRSGRDGQLADEVQVTVAVKATAGPGELTDFVVALPDRARAAGLEAPPGLELVSTSGARLDIDWRDRVVADEVGRGVREWWAVATSSLGPTVAATARTDGGASYVLTLGDGETGAVAAAYLALGPLMRPDTAWQVLATSGPTSLDLSVAAYPTRDQLATWDRLLAAAQELPADLPPSLVSLHLLDRTVADLAFVAPAGTTDEELTLERYGDRLWPAVRPQLAALAGLARPWTYGVTWAPADADYDEHILISYLSDHEPVDNGDEPSRWSRAAADYVSSL